MPALIFLNGDCTYSEELKKLILNHSVVVAADGGYEHCRKLGLVPDYLVGDMDSISSSGLEEFSRISPEKLLRYPPEKDFTDSEIALNKVLENNVKEIIFIGAMGGRYDHMFANQMTAASLALKGINVTLTDGNTFMYSITADNPFTRSVNKSVKTKYRYSLIPCVEDIEHVDISGLKYSLSKTPLMFGSQRGVSNENIVGGEDIDDIDDIGDIDDIEDIDDIVDIKDIEDIVISVSNGVAFLCVSPF